MSKKRSSEGEGGEKEYIAQVEEQFTFNEKVEGSSPSALKKEMARKTHAIGYRLGESR